MLEKYFRLHIKSKELILFYVKQKFLKTKRQENTFAKR